METALSDITQATPGWFTRILREQEVLDQGEVTRVTELPATPGLASRAARFEVEYTGGVSEFIPSSFFLKYARAGVPPQLGRKEVEFYTRIAPAMADPPVVRCFSAVCDAGSGDFHIVLEDLSGSHEQTEFPLPPSLANCELAVDALAQIHGAWWGDARLGDEIGAEPEERPLEPYVDDIEATYSGFSDFLGDRLTPQVRSVYEQALRSIPHLWCSQGRRRLTEERALTLKHGDAQFWSFLYPRDAGRNRTYIIDWSEWAIGVGADDLAYLIGLFLHPARRRELERPLLERYHRAVVAAGAAGYTWESLWYDYRVSMVRTLFIPVAQWTLEIPALVWWPHIDRAALAYEDLDCAQLLRSLR